jgi:outer membrane lipopolysaccharide assembly protein LptE/RlpB
MRAAPGALLILTAALLAGCGYHLSGHTSNLPPDIHSIGVPMFVNKTDRPELEQRITEYVVSQFVTRGRYQILSTDQGVDAVLRGEITTYMQSPVSINSQGRATRYEILINARAALIRTSDDKVLWQDDHFVFRRQYDVSNQVEGTITQESVALDLVSNDFAESVVTSILEGF